MTFTDTTTTRFDLVTFDLYKDIHKGIRTELFALVTTAAQTDPSDRAGRAALATHVAEVHQLLESHAEHEDAAVQPHIEACLPAIAEQVAVDHLSFETRGEAFVALAREAEAAAPGEQRRLLHLLHLDLAAFTSSYLAHQDLEERVIMPALEQAIGVEAVIGVHHQIIGAIPPDELARTIALMLPAMNLDDRAEMLGGMQAEAPAEVFAGMWSLAGSVLTPTDLSAVGRRLGIG
jgi:hypothetical protein